MTPRIYAACLASYNSGHLHGAWIDAAQDEDAIRAEIQDMLANSPIPGAEEYAIHDYDGLPSTLGEWPDLDQLAQIANGVEAYGDAFRAFVELVDLDSATVAGFEDRYIGQYRTRGDLAEELLENSGDLSQVPEHLQPFIDFDAYGRNLILSGAVVEQGGHWFWND